MSDNQPNWPTAATPETGNGPPKRSWWKRPWGIGIIGAVALLVVVAVVADPDDGEAPAAATNENDAPDATEEREAAGEDDVEPTQQPPVDEEGSSADESPTESTPTVEEEPERAPEPEPEPEFAFTEAIELTGVGDDIVAFDVPDDEPAIVHFTHDGSSNFQVTGYDQQGERAGGLVNEIGVYDGVRPLNFRDPPVQEFEIAADGAWSATIRPLLDARSADAVTEGSGDEVLLVLNIEASSVQATHDGESNFQVTSWGDRRSGMVNEIGPYAGRVRLENGSVALEVVADGNWTFDFSGG